MSKPEAVPTIAPARPWRQETCRRTGAFGVVLVMLCVLAGCSTVPGGPVEQTAQQQPAQQQEP